jgi:hypothetical protein
MEFTKNLLFALLVVLVAVAQLGSAADAEPENGGGRAEAALGFAFTVVASVIAAKLA